MASMKTLIIRLERLDPSLIPVKKEVKEEPLTSEGEDDKSDGDSSHITKHLLWAPRLAKDPMHAKIYQKYLTIPSNNLFQCNLCQKEFTRRYVFLTHFKNIHLTSKAKRSFKCDICSKTFSKQVNFQHHHLFCSAPRSTTNPEKRKCSLCPKEFCSPRTLQDHLKQIHYPKFKCDICQKAYGRISQLNKHKTSVHTNSSFKCQAPNCDKIYTRFKNLKKHSKLKHGLTLRSTESEQLILPDDISIPLEDKPKAVITDKSRKCKKSTSHVATPPVNDLTSRFPPEMFFVDEETGQYRCYLCPNKYRDKNCWLRHYKITHLGIKKPPSNAYMCDLCGKRVSQRRRLISHKLVCGKQTKPEGKSKCEECLKTFRTADGLRKHRKIVHAVDKQSLFKFKCDICSKLFNQRNRLMEHKAWIHSGIKVKCKVPGCDKSYASATSLQSHVKIDHIGNNEGMFEKISQVKVNLLEDVEDKKPSPALASSLEAEENTGLSAANNLPEVSSSPSPSPSFPASPQIKEEIEVDLTEYPESSEIKIELPDPLNNEDCDAIDPLHSSTSASGTDSDSDFEPEPPPTPNLKETLSLNDSYSILKSGKFKCKLCSKVYSKKQPLKIHFDTIHLKIKHKCDLCPNLYSKRENLKFHLERDHPSLKKLFTCSTCNKKFYFESDLNYHSKMKHNPNRNLKCPQCPLIFKKKRELNNHVKNKHLGMITVKADLSQSSLIAAVSFKEINKQLTILPTGFQCKVCTKIFSQQTHFQVHYRYIHLGIRYKCESCLKTFPSIYDIKMHWKHDCMKPNGSPEAGQSQSQICHLCGKGFKSFQSLGCHMNTFHSDDNQKARRFLCEFCTKSFISKVDLNTHINAKHLNQRLNCDYPGCGKSYSFPSALRRHKNVEHRAKKPEQDKPTASSKEDETIYTEADWIDNYEPLTNYQVKCKICFKNFLKIPFFKRHFQSAHLKLKLKCENCNKLFTRKENLNNHQKVCSLPLQFKCDICSKEFEANAYLQKHIKRHLNMEKVKCDLCNLEFKQKRSLKEHIKIVHLKIRYNCDVKGCEKSYTTIHSLKTHKKIEH